MAIKRGAHRPSRKFAVVEAALRLHATSDTVAITVADIASAADMTAPAVYYHYASQEEILLDGLSRFADAMLEQVRNLLGSDAMSPPGDLPVRMLDWLDHRRDAAIVWFTRTGGLGTAIEACRRDTNDAIISEIVRSVRSFNPAFSLPHSSVVSAGIFSALEISATAWLLREEALVLGREDDFRREVAALGAKIFTTPAPPL